MTSANCKDPAARSWTAGKGKGMGKDRAPRAARRRKDAARRGARFSVHPLFLVLGVYYCFVGRLPVFLLSALVALQHECAHAFAAARLGYRLDRVVLMPYGAVIDGDLEGIGFRDEICVAVWGPLCNLITAAAFYYVLVMAISALGKQLERWVNKSDQR